jgi:Arc/MetJ-type ribon-helix-helix transcriptional regulator
MSTKSEGAQTKTVTFSMREDLFSAVREHMSVNNYSTVSEYVRSLMRRDLAAAKTEATTHEPSRE